MTVTGAALPLIPDGDQARDWAEQELADPRYAATEPTPFDRFARAVGDFVAGLFSGDVPGSVGPWLTLVAVIVVVAVILVAFLIWGRPRTAARSRTAAALFGDTERRSAAELRKAAEAAAATGDWDEAIVLRFRALARGLEERTLVEPVPGTTVHGFARAAGDLFPDARPALDHAADAFDDVRYLRRRGTPTAYREIVALDVRLQEAKVEAVPA